MKDQELVTQSKEMSLGIKECLLRTAVVEWVTTKMLLVKEQDLEVKLKGKGEYRDWYHWLLGVEEKKKGLVFV